MLHACLCWRCPLQHGEQQDRELQQGIHLCTRLAGELPSGGARVVVDYRHETPLPLAFHMMVMADAFVMSRSSLPMAAALLSNGTDVRLPFFPPSADCWARARRPLPSWRRVGCKWAAPQQVGSSPASGQL